MARNPAIRPINVAPTRTGMPALDRVLDTLRVLGPRGFTVIRNLGTRGPEFHYSDYPKEWVQDYEARGRMWFDPVLRWALTHDGQTRWSEVEEADPFSIMVAAKKHGLNYGAIFARGGLLARKKTILSLAREDREFTDEELALTAQLLDRVVQDAHRDTDLNSVELEALRHMRDGKKHKEIALLVGSSPSTVKARITSARKKLGAATNTGALSVALQRKLI